MQGAAAANGAKMGMLAGGALALAKFTRSRAKVSDIPRSCEGKCMHARATRRGHTCHVSAPSVGACTSHQRLPGALPTRACGRVCKWFPGLAARWAQMQLCWRPGLDPRLQQQARRLQARQRQTRRQQARRRQARRRAGERRSRASAAALAAKASASERAAGDRTPPERRGRCAGALVLQNDAAELLPQLLSTVDRLPLVM